MYILAQFFGICSMVSCFLVPMFKKKWQIFLGVAFNNLFIGLNFVLLGEVVSGLMNLFGIAQCLLCIYHVTREKPVPVAETIFFTALGTLMSISGLTRLIGVLPLIAVASYNISVFVRKEQLVRKFLLINAGAWVLYDALILSTSLLGHMIGLVSTALALWKYREKKSES